MTVKKEVYSKEHGINQYTLSNNTGGLTVKIIDHGATITNIFVKDKNGVQRDIVLGWDDIDGYLSKRGQNRFFGATIGRCANRLVHINNKIYFVKEILTRQTLHKIHHFIKIVVFNNCFNELNI